MPASIAVKRSKHFLPMPLCMEVLQDVSIEGDLANDADE
jgi:hypothetical protein